MRFKVLVGLITASILHGGIAGEARGDLMEWGTYIYAAASDRDSSTEDFYHERGGRGEWRTLYDRNTLLFSDRVAGRVRVEARTDRFEDRLRFPKLSGWVESGSGRGIQPNAAAEATALAIEGFTYDSSATEAGNFELAVELTGFEFVDNASANGTANVGGQYALFHADTYSFDPSNWYEYEYFNGFNGFSPVFLDLNSSSAVEFTLQPGESVYLAAQLSLRASGEASIASSENSLITSIAAANSTPGALAFLSSSSSSVPEPSTLGLLGLACLGGLSRRRRT